MQEKTDSSPMPLEPADRKFFEEAFAQDLADVRVIRESHFSPSKCNHINRILGSSWGSEVFVTPLVTGLLRRIILAHEITHVIQRRNATLGYGLVGCAEMLEREAHHAAAAVAKGWPPRCRLADLEHVPRGWNWAGHYYTTYLIMLAAGLENRLAFSIAFYAQMPDQVEELDATIAGVTQSLTFLADIVAVSYMQPTVVDRTPERSELLRKIRAKANDVQLGLHCLTGRSSITETQRRRSILTSLPLNTFEFGLAIHPFGDSFAHRQIDNPKLMYGPVMGHFIEKFRNRDPHTPDYIEKFPNIYEEYGIAMYEIVTSKTPAIRRLLTQERLKYKLMSIADFTGDTDQIAYIRETANELGRDMGNYRPEFEGTIPWKIFKKNHPWMKADLLVKALRKTHEWA